MLNHFRRYTILTRLASLATPRYARRRSGSVSGVQEAAGASAPNSKWASSYLTQLKVLTHRAMRNSRSAIFTFGIYYFQIRVLKVHKYIL